MFVLEELAVNFSSLAPALLAFVLWKVGSLGVGKRRGGASEKEKEWWSGSISSGDPELLQYHSLVLQSSASLQIARSPAHLCGVDNFLQVLLITSQVSYDLFVLVQSLKDSIGIFEWIIVILWYALWLYHMLIFISNIFIALNDLLQLH